MVLKLLFDPESGRVLGAQAGGGEGVDKRIDVLAVAIQAGMTVFDLEELELAYFPQFGSAKDPVNMAGFVAAGMLRGDHPQIDFATLRAIPQAEQPLLLDVRTPEEYAKGGKAGVPAITQGKPVGYSPPSQLSDNCRSLPGSLRSALDELARRGLALSANERYPNPNAWKQQLFETSTAFRLPHQLTLWERCLTRVVGWWSRRSA